MTDPTTQPMPVVDLSIVCPHCGEHFEIHGRDALDRAQAHVLAHVRAKEKPAGWYVKPLRPRGYSRRPHYYEAGEDESLCGKDARERGELPFDPSTMLTTVNDPRLGAPQFRRACELCAEALRWAEAHESEGATG